MVSSHTGWWWPRGALNQRGGGPTGPLGEEGRAAGPLSRLNGFLWSLCLSCPVSLGQVYSGASGEGDGQEEEEEGTQSSLKAPKNVSRERKGGTRAWGRGDVKKP